MANQRIKIQKLKKLIELTIFGTAQRPISTILGIHRRTVINYQGLLKTHTGGDLNVDIPAQSEPCIPGESEPLIPGESEPLGV